MLLFYGREYTRQKEESIWMMIKNEKAAKVEFCAESGKKVSVERPGSFLKTNLMGKMYGPWNLTLNISQHEKDKGKEMFTDQKAINNPHFRTIVV